VSEGRRAQLTSRTRWQDRGALLTFFSETARAKVRAVQEHVLALLCGGRKAVVFAHHQFMLDALHAALGARVTARGGGRAGAHLCSGAARRVQGLRTVRVDGATSSATRQALCAQFQTRDEVRAALLSITAAGTGLTLTAASLVVFAELFWNPGVGGWAWRWETSRDLKVRAQMLLQAEDRVHRVGQEAAVEVQYLVARGTADDHIWALVKHKLHVLGRGGLSKDDFNSVDKVTVVQQEPAAEEGQVRAAPALHLPPPASLVF